jgi:hypothetical protein
MISLSGALISSSSVFMLWSCHLRRQRATVCVSFGHRLYSAQAEEAPKEEYSAKIQKLVKEISALNLMEVAELTSCLKVLPFSNSKGGLIFVALTSAIHAKKRKKLTRWNISRLQSTLNISDVPMMAMGGAMPAASAPAAAPAVCACCGTVQALTSPRALAQRGGIGPRSPPAVVQ